MERLTNDELKAALYGLLGVCIIGGALLTLYLYSRKLD